MRGMGTLLTMYGQAGGVEESAAQARRAEIDAFRSQIAKINLHIHLERNPEQKQILEERKRRFQQGLATAQEGLKKAQEKMKMLLRGAAETATKAAAALSSGMQTSSGGSALGQKLSFRAKSLSNDLNRGATSLEQKLSSGAKSLSNNLSRGASSLEGKLSSGAKSLSNNLSRGASSLEGKLSLGAKSLSNNLSSSASSLAQKMKESYGLQQRARELERYRRKSPSPSIASSDSSYQSSSN
jgi:hypothetical protein